MPKILKKILKAPHFPTKVRLIALYGLFLSLSTQMLYSHLALFLKFGCNTSDSTIASIDGFVEFLSYLTRIFSGAISDYLYDRKLLLIIGCMISAIIKPVFAVTNSIFTVIFAEIIERLGSGVQAAPRDALIADLSPKSKLGAALGFCKALKTIGGILGSIIALVIIWLSSNNYRLLFILSAIPAVIALFCVLKIEPSKIKFTSGTKKFDNPFQKKYLKSMDAHFWKIIMLAFCCELGHFGDSLLTIKSTQFFSQTLAGMTSVFAAAGQILCTYCMGIAADKTDKIRLLKLSLLLIILSYITILCDAKGMAFLISVSILCGQYASMQLLFLAIITTHVTENLRGTAIGIFYCTIGTAYALSTNTSGFLCENFGYDAAFLYALLISCISFVTANRFTNHTSS